MDLTRMQQWDTILAQPKLRRRDAKYRDPEGLYPLHWAAAGSAPSTVLERLLHAYPPAIRRPDTEGSLPLHFCAHYGAHYTSFELLYTAYPAAAQQPDVYGRTPLYHATEKQRASGAVLRLLAGADASVLTRPLVMMGEPPQERMGGVQTPLYMLWTMVLRDSNERQQWCCGKQWEKAVWMVQTAHEHRYGAVHELLTACIAMDVYLPEPAIAIVLKHQYPSRRVPEESILMAARTPSYSLDRALQVISLLLQTGLEDECAVRTALVAAVVAGQPWSVLELFLDHHHHSLGITSALSKHPLACMAAVARPMKYSSLTTPTLPRRWDPLRLEDASHKESDDAMTLATAQTRNGDDDNLRLDYQHLETIYQLLRRDPMQICSNIGQIIA